MTTRAASGSSRAVRGLAIISIVVALILVACGAPGSSGNSGAEEAAKQGLQTWSTGNSTAYRNASFKTGVSGDTFANVEVVAELPVKGTSDWLENRAFVQVMRVNGNWQPPLDFKFELTANAVSTREAGKGATATAQYQAARASQTTIAQGQVATATAYSQGQIASATAYSQGQIATATAQVQARQNAAATATQSQYGTATAQTYATGTALVREVPTVTAASADFTAKSLPTGWAVTRPDPARWTLTGAALQIRPVQAISSGSYYNSFFRPLPTQASDLDIIMKLNNNSLNSGDAFWFGVSSGQSYDDFFGVGVTLDRNGPAIRGYGSSNSSLTAEINGDIFFRVSRREGGKKLTAFYSRDGQSWTFVAERDGRSYTHVAFAGVSPVKPGTPAGTTPTPARNVTPEAAGDYVVNVISIRFEIPKGN